MPRPLRVEIPGGIYHVDTVAVHDAAVFRDDRDRRRWMRLLSAVVSSFDWTCLSYCLVTNHYHLVVRIQSANLASGMQYLNSRHAQLFNQRYERRGHLFGARYHAERLERDSHALEVARYVPLNAVKAGLRSAPEDWPWSSYAAAIGFAPEPSFLDSSWILGLFAIDRAVAQRRYQTFVDEGLRRLTLDRPRGVRPLEDG